MPDRALPHRHCGGLAIALQVHMPAAGAARALSPAKRVRRLATRGIGNAAFAANVNSQERTD
ncbi:hypothetical protein [Roseiflexus sp.]|uniref:hypothetical protein n=1 Tax=Roseiflexus sp. TaxID=2562120 RepID=UPI00398A8782